MSAKMRITLVDAMRIDAVRIAHLACARGEPGAPVQFPAVYTTHAVGDLVTLRLARRTGHADRPDPVRAMCIGRGLALHRGDLGMWVVTHIPTGAALVRSWFRRDAVRLAYRELAVKRPGYTWRDALWLRVFAAWMQSEPEQTGGEIHV